MFKKPILSKTKGQSIDQSHVSGEQIEDGVLTVRNAGPFGNLIKANEAILKGKRRLENAPCHIRLEVTTRCNLTCLHCIINNDSEAPEDMDTTLLSRIDEQLLPLAATVQIGDQGEPLLYRHIDDIYRLIGHHSPVRVKMFTNGMTLSKKVIDRLLRSPVTELVVSIDGGTKESFESVRRGASFPRVVSNLQALKEGIEATPECRISLSVATVVMMPNYGELQDIVMLANDIGARRLYLSELVSVSPTTESLSTDSIQQNVDQAVRSAIELARSLNMEVFTNVRTFEPSIPAADVDLAFYTGRLEVVHQPLVWYRNSRVICKIQLFNDSPYTWSSSGGEAENQQINLSYHLYDASGKLRKWDGERTPLPRNIPPGSQATIDVMVQVPDDESDYVVEFDLVNEGYRWFGIGTQCRFTPFNGFKVEAGPENDCMCEYPWKYASIKIDGDFRACRFTSLSMGNLNDQTVEEIWNGPRYQALRRSILDGSYSVCRATCGNYQNYAGSQDRCRLQVLEQPTEVQAGERVEIPVRVMNTGNEIWPTLRQSRELSFFTVSYHILTEDRAVYSYEGVRTELDQPVSPGESIELHATIKFPDTPGRYVVRMAVVHENISWLTPEQPENAEFTTNVHPAGKQ